MSRADYLAKYLNNPSSSEKSKKKKHKKKEHHKTTITIEQPKGLVIPNLEDDLEEPADDDEFAPVRVKSNEKTNKGFKRIDTGELVNPEQQQQLTATSQVQETPKDEQPETIYRDSTGRIIDISQRQADLEAAKLRKSQERKVTEVRTSSVDQARQEHEVFKPRSSNFEDPMNSFAEKHEYEDTEMLKYVYNKGVNVPNRFGIPAGYFWDGVDRSNGFEELMIRKQNERSFNKIESKINETYELDLDV
ncbi:Pre-mRNA-splicing factor CWC26 [Candida viswanathii]|uniref:Pre-mRNA-splicing factor CWC26 n=1 Tax=Candida viswanathii TaxID=5486 RepID=A0A367YDG2_9ASCO|nr:Pre-mRNA-splicing factor CWC26 [Candida viswanathii]